MSDLRTRLEGSPYQGYSYSYPHKTAYRPLAEPVPLAELWARERKDALYLYLHVPFCGMRCGFCNLFTKARPEGSLVDRYLDALGRQARVVREAIGEASFARMAVGGGTPTFLEAEALDCVLGLAERVMGAGPGRIPISVEASPGTLTAEKLRVLADRGTTRLSLGVESFDEAEARAVNRPQATAEVERALDLIREARIPTLNLDLIYGLPGQSVASWLASLHAALRHRPEELYLYPLYVRPQTTLGRAGRDWDDLRLACYREGRSLLLGEGYAQVSMRMFRSAQAPPEAGPPYRCQEDGMIGLGCGARSYAAGLHYADAYAVRQRGVGAILEGYASRPGAAFGLADHGHRLSEDDRRRRFVIQSLLSGEGLSFSDYSRQFGSELGDDLPEIAELEEAGLATRGPDALRLNERGIERSDVIGPWLYSRKVRTLMEDYEWH
ncbi:Oxygen-independent coproporphyrinogen-III oxidase 1 [Aquisphaera giovannonii]|uniref:Oxygen-independent coproporphyrinogen-III oxidase 1 n=1 Tax=Aquisphaera giovannonii TaxID=406548 RepID=A0A5B9VW25_9BACT|nr:STM4012 family radical SAM protein [Aquisphaera giovannonii]QEH32438.1 Oxygen-independent coproporphyrinogen-III oxidase 1 [Aquisphaera giovannonii]